MKVILILISVLVFFSCEKREDIVTLNNDTPTLQIKGENNWNTSIGYSTTIYDSVKLNKDYKYSVLVTDQNESFKWTIVSLFNSENFIFDNGIYKSFKSSYSMDGNSIQFNYKTSTPGENFIKLIVEDNFNATNEIDYRLISFNNMSPVAKLSVTKVTTGSIQNEYIFNASNSYDKDAKYGGKVRKYFYEITKSGSSFYKQIISNLSSINYVFQTTGTFSINLSVEDDEGAVSIIDNQIVTVI